MIDLRKQNEKANCPTCKRSVTVSLKQITDEVSVKCSCGQVIQLKDKNHSNKKAVNDINKALKDLQNTFKKFGR
jgi:transposase-like protein